MYVKKAQRLYNKCFSAVRERHVTHFFFWILRILSGFDFVGLRGDRFTTFFAAVILLRCVRAGKHEESGFDGPRHDSDVIRFQVVVDFLLFAQRSARVIYICIYIYISTNFTKTCYAIGKTSLRM